jgi:UDP:flavonoid glycosyltransferase YjiC (YdhE family)
MFVTSYPEQVPADLPANVGVFGYLPFSELLPKTAMLVYHGGIGTLAQATKAAVPQITVPSGHDQFDNGWRVERLGIGRSVPQSKYRARTVAAAIDGLLDNPLVRERCVDLATRVHPNAVTRACQLIEQLALRSETAPT